MQPMSLPAAERPRNVTAMPRPAAPAGVARGLSVTDALRAGHGAQGETGAAGFFGLSPQAAGGHGFTCALILAPREELTAVDRTALRMAGIRSVGVMTSGVSAARRLARQRKPGTGTSQFPTVDMVICHERMADMTAIDFLRLVRAYPLLLDLPVVVVSGAATRDGVLAAIGAGCSGFLGRPYTLPALEGQLRRARQARNSGAAHLVAQGAGLLSDEEFDRALDRFAAAAANAAEEAEAHFLDGTAHLLREQWDDAIAAFNRTLRCNALHAEACIGLADAWRGKGDTDKSLRFRRRAGEIYARARQWRRAQQVFADLLASAPAGTANPLLAEAARLLRQGRVDDAAAALLAGRELTPGAPLHEHVARACQFTDAPEHAAAAMCRAVGQADPDLGTHLHHRLLGRFGAPGYDVDSHETPPPLLHRLPGGVLLHDVLMVARHTLKVWRQMDI